MPDTATTVGDQYDRAGEAYDRQTDGFNRRIAYPVLVRMLRERLKSLARMRVLDIGCGSGRLIETLERYGAYAAGIDISAASVARGRGRELAVFHASQLTLPFRDRTFDATVSYHALNYLPYALQPIALREQARVLARGGSLVMACFFTPQEREEPHLVEQLGERFCLYLRTRAELESLLQDAGFVGIDAFEAWCGPRERDALFGDQASPAIERLKDMLASAPYAIIMTARTPD